MNWLTVFCLYRVNRELTCSPVTRLNFNALSLMSGSDSRLQVTRTSCLGWLDTHTSCLGWLD